MKTTGTKELNVVPLYDPFVHFTSDDVFDYLEAMINVKAHEEIQSVVIRKLEDILLVVINIDTIPNYKDTGDNKGQNIIYTDKISLPPNANPDLRIIVLVVHGDPEEGGTVVVRYGDIE